MGGAGGGGSTGGGALLAVFHSLVCCCCCRAKLFGGGGRGIIGDREDPVCMFGAGLNRPMWGDITLFQCRQRNKNNV